jgi:hypothetical protein
MKKLSLILLAFLFIGLGNVIAQSDTPSETITDEVKKECPFTKTEDGKLICVKTGKECSKEELAKCKKGGKKSCCSSKKSSNGGFNFNKTNDYSGTKSSCKGKAKRSRCCKGAKKKGACSKKSSTEKEADEDAKANDTDADDTNTDE